MPILTKAVICMYEKVFRRGGRILVYRDSTSRVSQVKRKSAAVPDSKVDANYLVVMYKYIVIERTLGI